MNLMGSAAPSAGTKSIVPRTTSEQTDRTKDVRDMGTPFPSGEGAKSQHLGIHELVSGCHKRRVEHKKNGRARERESSFLQPLLERVTFHQLHDEIVNAVLFSDVVERADVRVVQAAGGGGFAFEAFPALGGVGEVF